MNGRELKPASDSEGEERYRHAVQLARESGEVWVLKTAEFLATFQIPDGEKVLFIWPTSELASAQATGEWVAMRPHRLRVEDLTQLVEPRVHLGIFLTGGRGTFAVVAPEKFVSRVASGFAA